MHQGGVRVSRRLLEIPGRRADGARMQRRQLRCSQKFIKKYNLPFPLLLDPDKKIATEYGVANGIPILGLDKRVTYVIDEDGRILKVYPKVDPSIHATEILSALPPPPPRSSLSPAATEAPK